MKTIAITANDDQGLNGEMSMHFGHCSHFVLVDVDDTDQLTITKVQANPYAEQHQPGQIPEYIKSLGADVVLSGGMGGRAIEWFQQLGIEVATGHRPSIEAAVKAYLAGELNGASGCTHDHH